MKIKLSYEQVRQVSQFEPVKISAEIVFESGAGENQIEEIVKNYSTLKKAVDGQIKEVLIENKPATSEQREKIMKLAKEKNSEQTFFKRLQSPLTRVDAKDIIIILEKL